MKRRLMIWMTLVFMPTLLLLSWFMSERVFHLAMQREQERAQMAEALIASEVRKTIVNLPYDGVVQAARQYRRAYAAQGIELIFCYNRIPLGGATLPNRNYEAMLGRYRTGMLDTLSRPEKFVIGEPLTGQVTLLVLRDVSDLYEMRAEMQRIFLLAAVMGSAVMIVMSWLVASRFTRPVARLTDAAQALAAGETGQTLPTGRRDELGALARSFAEMEKAVLSREESLKQEAANRQAMLDALAHEMRTPLCSLLGNVRLLEMPLEEQEQSQILDEMAREIKRLTEMDAQLMKLSLLHREPLEVTEVAMVPLLQETAGRLAPQAGEIHIEVMGPECVIPGDRELLSLLADNLTVNAIRASSPGQTVTLTATERGFMVQDEGLGMTEEQLSHVFEPFYRADKARSRSLGGAGLGLSLCRRIAELHRGKLHFASSPGEGTVVTVTTCLQPVEDSVTPSDVPYAQEVMHP